MSYHQRQERGGEAVGRLAELGAVERLVVESVRLWLAGPDAQAEVWNRFATGLGPERGRRALAAFEAWLRAVAVAQSRRRCRHAPACPCVGRDEADLAAIVTLAGRGDAEAAAARAARLVRSERLPAVTAAAAELGRLLADAGPPRSFRRLH